MEIKEYIKNNILLFDGAMGTMLQNSGLKIGENPEIFGFKNKGKLLEIHKRYLDAGANVITTNTFGANELKLKPLGYTVEQIVDNAVSVAKEATESFVGTKPRYVALDIGPIGEMLQPMGTLSFDKAYEIFSRQMIQGEKSGADLIIIETMMDLYEAKAAILAAKENTSLPVFCTMTFDENGRSFTGCLPESMVITLEGLGVDVLGVNCSLGPNQLIPIVDKIVKISNIPVMVQANAGLPEIINGEAIYNIGEDEFFKGVQKFINCGVTIVGGCCGTNPKFINKISQNINDLKKVISKKESKETLICSQSKIVKVEQPMIVGERINPTGKKLLKEAIRTNNLDYIIKLGLEQINEGADILGVNIGLPEVKEEEFMPKVIKEIQSVIDTPLLIDSSNLKALEQGLRYYNGKPIVNSVNGKEESLKSILPMVKKYGACVVGLTLDENGIPNTAEDRYEIAEKIVDRALKNGIKKEDIIIDCLCLTVSAQQSEVNETLKCIRMVKEGLGVKTILGISNISFGLPKRKILNSSFLTIALSNGLDLAIVNPNEESIIEAINSFKVITNKDKGCKKYIEKYSSYKNSKNIISTTEYNLKQIIENGLKEHAKTKTIEMLNKNDENYVIDKIIIPTLEDIGRKYEKEEIFLPQLIQSAEVVKIALTVIKEKSLQNNNKYVNKGKIILATVKGDIHDIGKNIVKIMLENYGYEVIDLGKDVPIEEILNSAQKHNVKLIGLSALMTTTVKSMEETIKAIKEEGLEAKVFTGGAVLTQEYANNIGADYYSKDAKSAIEIAKTIF